MKTYFKTPRSGSHEGTAYAVTNDGRLLWTTFVQGGLTKEALEKSLEKSFSVIDHWVVRELAPPSVVEYVKAGCKGRAPDLTDRECTRFLLRDLESSLTITPMWGVISGGKSFTAVISGVELSADHPQTLLGLVLAQVVLGIGREHPGMFPDAPALSVAA